MSAFESTATVLFNKQERELTFFCTSSQNDIMSYHFLLLLSKICTTENWSRYLQNSMIKTARRIGTYIVYYESGLSVLLHFLDSICVPLGNAGRYCRVFSQRPSSLRSDHSGGSGQIKCGMQEKMPDNLMTMARLRREFSEHMTITRLLCWVPRSKKGNFKFIAWPGGKIA